MLVTIGIPFYNNEDSIAAAVRSIFAQTYKDWELILIDDGSIDNSLQLISQIKDSRVKIYSDGLNKGLPYRLNQISTLANGKYLARMDADDLMHPLRIEKQVRFLEANPTVDIVGTDIFSIDNLNYIKGKRKSDISNITPEMILKKGSLIVHPSIMGKKEWFINNQYNVDLKRVQDFELWCRTCSKTTFSIINDQLLFYREAGVFNLRKYLSSCYYSRKVIKKYGPKICGNSKTLLLIFKTYIKGFLYSIFYFLNLHEILIKQRYEELNPEEILYSEKIIKTILNTELPINI